MKEQQLGEITGTVTNLLEKDDACEFYFTLQDEHNRLLTVKYKHADRKVSRSLYESLKEGISVKKIKNKDLRVQIYVRGPIEIIRDFYEGVGSITILD